MELKLAWRNMRRSVRDYAIYFVTLVIGVAVFYAFNAISSQTVLYDLAEAQAQAFQIVSMFVVYFSVAVACVLGFLVIYANHFLIKRRRHEFGMYLMLGMRISAVSRIVLYETVGVGIVSFIVGIALGFGLSQGLSFATAALFSIPMVQYHFVFSLDALGITGACFAGIFVIVALFNLVSLRSVSLANLFKANAKNQRNPVRNPWACLGIFAVALVLLAFAYKDCIASGIIMLDKTFWTATALMLIGTLLLFWSLAGFTIAVITHLRGVYLRGLIPFTVHQIASKINTAFLSLWVICVMLFFAITISSCGLGLIDAFTKSADESNPYDATISSYVTFNEGLFVPVEDLTTYKETTFATYPELTQAEAVNWDAAAYFADSVADWKNLVAEAVTLNEWGSPFETYGTYSEGIDIVSVIDADTWDNVKDRPVYFLSESQVNELLRMSDKDPITLEDQKYLIANNQDVTKPLAELYLKHAPTLQVPSGELVLQPGIVNIQIEDNLLPATSVMMIVSDQVIEDLQSLGAIPVTSRTNINYTNAGSEGDTALISALTETFPVAGGKSYESDEGFYQIAGSYEKSVWPLSRLLTRADMMDQAGSMRMLVTFLAIYMGFVLLITTAAVLAIQQLSEVSDSEDRYRALSRLGCDTTMLGRSLFAQVLVYFAAPLVVALCHSACAIYALSGTLFAAFGVDTVPSIITALILVLVIYGLYFLVTYTTSRSLVKSAIQAR